MASYSFSLSLPTCYWEKSQFLGVRCLDSLMAPGKGIRMFFNLHIRNVTNELKAGEVAQQVKVAEIW